VIMALDHPGQEPFYRTCRAQAPAKTRILGIAAIDEEGDLVRLDAMGLDGILHRPVGEKDIIVTVRHMLEVGEPALAH
jgi:hypothetical protein